MKPPKNQRAALNACFHCTHPDLDATDTLLLVYLAHAADYGTGKNSHPGNRNIADTLKLSDSPTDNRIRKNIQRGLIERTSRADGRGKASIYRICWESPYFPEESEPEKPPCVDGADSKPPCLERADSSETALHEHGNRPADPAKPPCEGSETALSRQAATKVYQNLPTNPPTSGGRMEGWILEHIDQMGVPDDGIRKILDARVQTKGEENVVRALNRFLERPNGIENLRTPYAMVVKELDMYLAKEDAVNAAVVQKAKEEEAIKASVDRQTVDYIRFRDDRPAQNETSLADLMADEQPVTPP